MPQDGKLTAGRYGTTRKSGNASRRGLQSAAVAFPAAAFPTIEPRSAVAINYRREPRVVSIAAYRALDSEQPFEDRAAEAIAASILTMVRPVLRSKRSVHSFPHFPNSKGKGLAKVRADLIAGLVTVSELAHGLTRDIAARYGVADCSARRIARQARERRIELPPQWQDKAK